ncbi:hypothetical protein WJF22_23385, partial [Salmonella enterica subsp. enterica serovar Corvallis]
AAWFICSVFEMKKWKCSQPNLRGYTWALSVVMLDADSGRQQEKLSKRERTEERLRGTRPS